MGSITKDSRGRSKYWIACYRAADGRRLKKSTGKTDKKQAEIILATLEHAEGLAIRGEATADRLTSLVNETLERLGLETIKTPSVKSWLESCLASKEAQVAPSTYSAYEQVTREFLDFLGPAGMLRRLDSISEADIERFVKLLRSEGRSASTINKLVRKYLSLPFERARKTGKIKFNPVMATLPERAEAFTKDTFTGEQVASLVRAASGTDWEGAILFAYSCGARLGDIANLRWTNLDIEAGVTTFKEGKTDKVAVLGLHPDFLDWVASAKKVSDDPESYVFPALAGRRLGGQGGLSLEFLALMKKADIKVRLLREGNEGKGRALKALTFHSFRHSAASNVFNQAALKEITRRVTNHSAGGVVDRYIHKDLEAIREATKLIPRLPRGDK